MKDKLVSGEFAIKDGAILDVISSVVKFTPNKKGTVTITLKCDMKDSAELQTTTGKIVFDKCGVFKKVTKSKSGSFKKVSVFITSTDDVQVRTENNDTVVTTDGVKGNHGN